MKMTYNVYSSMLGGYLAMGFETKEEAQSYIEDYHCKIEKTRMSVIAEREEFIEQEADYESEDQTDSLYYQSQEDYYNL